MQWGLIQKTPPMLKFPLCTVGWSCTILLTASLLRGNPPPSMSVLDMT